MVMLKIDDLFVTYGDEQFAELAVFLDLLRALQFLHQQHHWQSSGPIAFSDHLLFQRLYEGVAAEIDLLGEKTVSFGSTRLVNSKHSLSNMPKFLIAIEDGAGMASAGGPSHLARKSLLAEKSFVTAGEKLMKMLESKGLLSRGIENLLGGILDTHEGFIYLLKQRTLLVGDSGQTA